MAKAKKVALKRKVAKSASNKKYVVVTGRSYGNKLKGTKIYFAGKKPTSLKLMKYQFWQK